MAIATLYAHTLPYRTDKQFVHYLNTAVNSANELESHFLMARDRGVMRMSDYTTLLEQLVKTRKMLHGLIRKIEGKSPPG